MTDKKKVKEPKAEEPKAEEPKAEEPAKAVFLTAKKVADQLGIDTAKVQAMFDEGRIPTIAFKGKLVVAEEILKRVLDREFVEGDERYPARFVPGGGMRLKAYAGRKMWISPGKTKPCPPL